MRTRLESLLDTAPNEKADAAREEFPLPTLEQRINLYLMGVHGPRTYSPEERAAAREILIGEISTNLFGSNEKEGFEFRPQPDEIGSGDVAYSMAFDDRPLRQADESVEFLSDRLEDFSPQSEALEPKFEMPDRRRAKIGEVALEARLDAPLRAKSSSVNEAGLQTTSRLEVPREKMTFEELLGQIGHKSMPPKPPRRWGLIGTATFVGCILGTLATGGYHWLRSTTEPSSDLMAKLARSPTDAIERAKIRDLDIEMSWRFMRIAEDLIEARNVAGARAVLSEAAQIGSASAALTLGATYDPSEIANDYRQRRDQANVQEARRWYQRAKELGSTAAQQRLDRLGTDR